MSILHSRDVWIAILWFHTWEVNLRRKIFSTQTTHACFGCLNQKVITFDIPRQSRRPGQSRRKVDWKSPVSDIYFSLVFTRLSLWGWKVDFRVLSPLPDLIRGRDRSVWVIISIVADLLRLLDDQDRWSCGWSSGLQMCKVETMMGRKEWKEKWLPLYSRLENELVEGAEERLLR